MRLIKTGAGFFHSTVFKPKMEARAVAAFLLVVYVTPLILFRTQARVCLWRLTPLNAEGRFNAEGHWGKRGNWLLCLRPRVVSQRLCGSILFVVKATNCSSLVLHNPAGLILCFAPSDVLILAFWFSLAHGSKNAQRNVPSQSQHDADLELT